MKLFTLLIIFEQLTLLNSRPMLEASIEVKSLKNPLTSFKHMTPFSANRVSANSIEYKNIITPQSLFGEQERRIELKKPSLHLSSTQVSQNEFKSSANARITAQEAVQYQEATISVYDRLSSAASKALQPDGNQYWNKFTTSRDLLVAKSLHLLSNPRQLISSPGHLLSNIRSSLSSAANSIRETLNEAMPALKMEESDRAIWETLFRATSTPEDIQVINKYYEVLRGFDKKSSAVLEFQPSFQESVRLLKKNDPLLEKDLKQFMSHVLSPSEFERRSHILNMQADQFNIFKNWDSALDIMATKTGFSFEEVSLFGEKLGGKHMFPSFQNYDSAKNLKQLNFDERRQVALKDAWTKHLGQDNYKSRVALLQTLSEMKHPQTIPSKKISAWLAQGLDVNRMLKIADYTEEIFQRLALVPERPVFDLEGVEPQEVYDIFHDHADIGVSWSNSIEHSQLFLDNSEKKSIYLQLLSSFQELEKSSKPEKLSSIEETIKSLNHRHSGQNLPLPSDNNYQKSRYQLLQLIQNRYHLFSKAGHSSTNADASVKGTLAVLSLAAQKNRDLNLMRESIRISYPHMDLKMLETYYRALSGFNKNQNAMVVFQPNILHSIMEWKNENVAGNKILLNSMNKVLSMPELVRRLRTLELQLDQLRISKDWDSTTRSMQQMGYELDVITFGQKLGGKDILTLFKGVDFKQNWNDLESLAQTHADLKEAWRNFLKPQNYDLRVALLRTLSQMKHPNAIPSEEFSKWLVQGLDVNRMLRIVDYTEESFTGAAGSLPNFELKNIEEFKKVSHLFDGPTEAQYLWIKGPEHSELLKLSTADKYLEVRIFLENFQGLLQRNTFEEVLVLLSDRMKAAAADPKFTSKSGKESLWRRLLMKIRKFNFFAKFTKPRNPAETRYQKPPLYRSDPPQGKNSLLSFLSFWNL